MPDKPFLYVNGNRWDYMQFHLRTHPLPGFAREAVCLVETEDGFVRITADGYEPGLTFDFGPHGLKTLSINGRLSPFRDEDRHIWEERVSRPRAEEASA